MHRQLVEAVERTMKSQVRPVRLGTIKIEHMASVGVDFERIVSAGLGNSIEHVDSFLAIEAAGPENLERSFRGGDAWRPRCLECDRLIMCDQPPGVEVIDFLDLVEQRSVVANNG